MEENQEKTLQEQIDEAVAKNIYMGYSASKDATHYQHSNEKWTNATSNK